MQSNLHKLANVNVVVIDDDELCANLLVMILKRYSCDAKSYYDAYTAIESIKLKMPSIIFLDNDMRELSGVEAAKEIRQFKNNYKPIIIGLSGSGRRKDIELALAAGFDHYLLKPLDFNLLNEIVGNLNLLIN